MPGSSSASAQTPDMHEAAELIAIGNDHLSVTISPYGAELMSLRDRIGREWLWQGNPAIWNRRAPILFPFIGRCANNELRHQGKIYPAPNGHGFGPRSIYQVMERTPSSARLRLAPDDDKRRQFPFDLQLDVDFTLVDGVLHQTATVINVDDGPAVASVGFHPGFAWPSPAAPAVASTAYVVDFMVDESSSVHRIVGGYLSGATAANPVMERRLALDPELFRNDAIVFKDVASRSVWFGVPGHTGVRVGFDCPTLALWMRPGGRYLCIEPWQGHHCPEGFAGDVMDKPGMVALAPGGSFSRTMSIEIDVQEAQLRPPD